MLHPETVDDSTLELLRLLQNKEYLKGFYLTGGTALALYLGHRKSVDIDLFSNFGFDVTVEGDLTIRDATNKISTKGTKVHKEITS